MIHTMPPKKCPTCLQTVFLMDPQICLNGGVYHAKCAKCSTCGAQITLNNFASDTAGGLLCTTHYKEQNGARTSTMGESARKGMIPVPATSPPSAVLASVAAPFIPASSPVASSLSAAAAAAAPSPVPTAFLAPFSTSALDSAIYGAPPKGHSDVVLQSLANFVECRKAFDTLAGSLFAPDGLMSLPAFSHLEDQTGEIDQAMYQQNVQGQVVRSLDELYQAAGEAYPIFLEDLKTMLSDGGTGTVSSLPGAGGLTQILFESSGNLLVVPPLKGRSRAEEKMNDDYRDRVPRPEAHLLDIVRASVDCHTEAQMILITRALLEGSVPGLEVVRLKNRVRNPAPHGFRDLLLNVKIKLKSPSTGKQVQHICELQIHLKAMKIIEKKLDSHQNYEQLRTFFKGKNALVDERVRLLLSIADQLLKGQTQGAMTYPNLVKTAVEEGNDEHMLMLVDFLEFAQENGYRLEVRRAIVSLREARQGVLHIDTIHSTQNLANLLMEMGMMGEAEPLYQRVLEGKEKLLGPDDPDTLSTVNNLALYYNTNGRLDVAKALMKRVLEGNEARFGRNSEPTFNAMNNLGVILKDMGQYEEARTYHERTLAGREEVLGPMHRDTLSSMHNLAIVLSYLTEHDLAMQFYQRALLGRETVLGPTHVKTLDTLSDIGLALDELGQHAEAGPYLVRALTGRETVLGLSHPSVLDACYNLGLHYSLSKDWKDSISYYRRTVSGYELVFGLAHFQTLEAVLTLGDAQQAAGDAPSAEANYRLVLGRLVDGGSSSDGLSSTQANELMVRAKQVMQSLQHISSTVGKVSASATVTSVKGNKLNGCCLM